MLRSMLFMPGDSERKLAKSEGSAADALILDLEDSVAAERTAVARQMVRAYLDAYPARPRQLWVRINPLDTRAALLDLAAVVGGRPDGIILPKPGSGADVARLDHYLGALEARDGVEPGAVGIIPIATETAASLFTLGSYAGCSTRLAGMTWGAEDLAAALGAGGNRADDGEFAPPYALARTLCLAAAVAATVQPIDTLHADFRDAAGLEAFAAAPGLGVVGMNGMMLDMPHLRQARRVLAIARVG